MKRLLAIAVIVVIAAFGATTAVQAGQAGRDNTRNTIEGGILICLVFDCKKAVAKVFSAGDRDGVYNGNDYHVSAGEMAAYKQGQADALAELQHEREVNAYNLGRGNVGGNFGFGRSFGSFGSFGGRCYGC